MNFVSKIVLENNISSVPLSWGVVFGIIFFGIITAQVLTFLTNRLIKLIFLKKNLDFSSFVKSKKVPLLSAPIQCLIFIWTVSLCVSIFLISDGGSGLFFKIATVFTYLTLFWIGLRLTVYFEVFMLESARLSPQKTDDLLIPLLSKTLKIILFIVALISIAEILNLPLASLLAGLGIGGIAIAMAAKDTIANIFGSLTVVTDRPFAIGDWVKIDGVEGTVERLGFRSTRIRTFYNSLVSVPNSILLTASVDNLGERRYRRFKTMIAITYDTPAEKIEAFITGIRTLIDLQPETRKDYYMVHLNSFGSSSLDILLYVFFASASWDAELASRERLMLDIIRLAQKIGVEFAFPTQTIHLQKEHDPTPSLASVASVNKHVDLGKKTAQKIVDMYHKDV
jgi:MscS family membrane protein